MKQLLCLLLCCMLLVLPACAEEASVNSWSQINQAVSKGADWQQADTDGSFHLGEKKPLAGYENLYIGDWGTYPSMDGSTVCVPMAMELARQWLGLEEGDMNGFVNFSTTPYAYDRLTQGKPNPLATIKSQGVMMDDTHPIDLVLATYPNADERQAAADAGVELVYVPFCYDAFVFMVNEKNPVTSLTAQQIQQIYTGQYSSWKALGGESQKLYAYQRPHGSGSQTAMEEMVMQGLITVREAKTHPKRNYITRALGTSETVDVDLIQLECRPGDALLLCTDGLSNCVDERKMLEAMTSGQDGERIVHSLVQAALDAGGHDNITAMAVFTEEDRR